MKLSDINLCDLAQFEQGCPEAIFRTLREQAPVWFHPATPQAPDGEGFWVISKHADARAILKNHEDFSSETGYGARVGGGTTLGDMSTDMAPGLVLAMMDPPKHDEIRGLVSQGFYPRTLEALEPEIRRLTRRLLEPVLRDLDAGATEFDFLNRVATELPLQVICTVGGLPEADWHHMVEWADAAIAFAAHDKDTDTAPLIAKMTEMGMYAYGLVQKLRAEPNDSLMSIIVNAEINNAGNPRKLDDLEAIRFFNLLITGGTETTRNSIAYGYYALLQHPEQYAALEDNPDELLDGALEEMLRWSSAVHFNRRTAARDVEYGDQQIKRGDKVTVWYSSANRDADVFEDPYTFNIYRKKNPQVAFGYGIHHCLGAALARLEMKILFQELLACMKGRNPQPANDIRFIRSNRHQGVADMRVRVTPR
ncbi:MAG TPA: cytochrome P450 [Pseudomonadales bacterium]|nr:cytochrome P450 [Pseudomonadales bacterium]